MDTTKIDDQGFSLTILFLLKGKFLRPEIKRNDKYPLWDGEIIVYNSEEHKNSNIIGRIPVQLKSTAKSPKKNVTFTIGKVALEKYNLEGGIILIRPFIQRIGNYLIYFKILLPYDIKKILSEEKYAIKLEKISNIEEFEKHCIYFLKNRELQYNTKNYIDINEISEKNPRFELNTIQDEKLFNNIISGKYYSYYILDNKYRILCNLEIDKITNSSNQQVSIHKKIYFESITQVLEKENNTYLYFNPVLRIEFDPNEKQVKCSFSFNEVVTLKDLYDALDFMLAISKSKTFQIGESSFDLEQIEIPKINIENFLQLQLIKKLFKKLRIDFNSFPLKTLEHFASNSNILTGLIEVLINKKKIKFENEKDLLLRIYRIFNSNILVFFKKDESGFYTGHYFNQKFEKDKTFEIQVGQKRISCSKFLALNHVNRVKCIENYYDEVYKDLMVYYALELIDSYLLFALDCIHVFDEIQKEEFLQLAEKIFKFLQIEKNISYADIIPINLFQIKKRKGNLNNTDKEIIYQIKLRNENNLDIIASCLVLLELYSDFEILFNKFKKHEKERFASWPIYKLFINHKPS